MSWIAAITESLTTLSMSVGSTIFTTLSTVVWPVPGVDEQIRYYYYQDPCVSTPNGDTVVMGPMTGCWIQYKPRIDGAQVTAALGYTPYSASNPSGFITSSALSPYATVTFTTTGLAAKFNTPAGTTAQYVRGDGSLAPFPSIPSVPSAVSAFTNDAGYVNASGARSAISLTTTGSGAATYNSVTGNINVPTPPGASPFNYGSINTRTFAVSTAYQATDNTKAAVVKVSPSCTASLSLTAGGTCTIQARVGSSGLTCSTGTVLATWTNANTGTLTIGLGLNQTVGSPGNIELAIGEYFILCATSGTFTLANGIDRSQGF